MMINLSVNVDKFIEAMKALHRSTSVEVPRLMNYEMALLCEWVIKKIGGNPENSLSSQRRAGESATSYDIVSLFKPIPKGYDWWDYKPAKAGGISAVMLKKKKGPHFLVEKSHFLPNASMSELRRLHRGFRNAKGRVYAHNTHQASYGKLKLMLDYYVKKNVLKAFLKEKKMHVGKTKSAWVKAMQFFSSKSGGLNQWKIPSWVSDDVPWGNRYSVSSETFNKMLITGSWESGSNVPWVNKDAAKIINEALKVRIKDINSGYAALRLNGLMMKFGQI